MFLTLLWATWVIIGMVLLTISVTEETVGGYLEETIGVKPIIVIITPALLTVWLLVLLAEIVKWMRAPLTYPLIDAVKSLWETLLEVTVDSWNDS